MSGALFIVYKVLAFLVQLSTLAALAMASGLWLIKSRRRPRLASRLAWGGLIYLVGAGLLPVGNALILPLEERFAGVKPPGESDSVDGIIILGGFEDGWVSSGRGGLAVNESAERLTEGLRLARRHGAAKVVFSGGVGAIWSRAEEATGPVAAFFHDSGIAASRLVLEGKARNTHENATLTAAILKPAPGQRWLLVTSAYHMPRAVGLFRKTGFDVVPYPVDYRTRGPEDLSRLFERIPAGLMRTDLAVNEWLGLVAYRLLGRIDDLFPAP